MTDKAHTYVVSINGRPYARFVRFEHALTFIRAHNDGIGPIPQEAAARFGVTGRLEIEGGYLVEFSTKRSV